MWNPSEVWVAYLSYVLITSQYCEDFARILLNEAQCTLQICLAAKKFGWHFPKRQTGNQLDGLMFGQLLDMLDHSVDQRVFNVVPWIWQSLILILQWFSPFPGARRKSGGWKFSKTSRLNFIDVNPTRGGSTFDHE